MITIFILCSCVLSPLPLICFISFSVGAGHSRTIIGVEERREEVVLLVLDPQPRMAAILNDPAHHMQQLRRSVQQLKQRQYQIVFVDGIVLTEEERRVSLECMKTPSNCSQRGRGFFFHSSCVWYTVIWKVKIFPDGYVHPKIVYSENFIH